MAGAGGKEVGRISIRVVPDLDRFYSELRSKLQAIEKSLECKVRVVPDERGFREKVNAMTKGMDAQVKIKPDVDQTAFARDLAAMKAAARKAKIEVPIGTKRTLGSRFRGFGDGMGDIGRGIGKGFSLLRDDTTAIIVAVIALLAPALAVLAQALVALPALISAVAIPLGVFALGLGGIKKALEAVGLASTDKKGKLKAGEMLDRIRQPIEDVFEKGLVPVFQRLLDAAPRLTSALPRVAQGIVDIFGGLANAFTSDAAIANIQQLTGNVGNLLTQMAPGIASFSNSILELATRVSNHFPGLANWFNQLADKFSGWITRMETQLGKDGKPILDSAISNIRPVLDGVIHFLGQLLDAGLKLASNPEMAANIKNLFTGVTDFVVKGLPALAALFAMIAGLIDKLGKLPGGGIFDLALGNKDATNKNLLGKGLFGMDPNLGIGNFGKIWDALKLSLAPVLAEITIQFTTFFANLPSQIGGAFTGIWDGLVAAAQGVIPGILAAFQGLGGQLQGIWGGIVSAAVGVWNGLVPAAAGIIANVVSVFVNGGSQIVSTVMSWGAQIVSAVAGIASQMFAAGANIVQNFVNGLKSIDIGSVVSGLFGGVLSLIPHSPAKEGPFSGQGWTSIFTGGQAIGQQFQDGLEQGFQGVLDRARALTAEVADQINNGIKPNPDNINQQLKAIKVESDQLRVQRDALDKKDPARKVLQDQLSQLSTVRNQLQLQKDQLGYADKYGDKQDDISKTMEESLNKMVGIGVNFGMANFKQFTSDIGWSGNGAVPKLMDAGLSWGQQLLGQAIKSGFGGGGTTVFNVANMDDALQAERTRKNQQALQHAGR